MVQDTFFGRQKKVPFMRQMSIKKVIYRKFDWPMSLPCQRPCDLFLPVPKNFAYQPTHLFRGLPSFSSQSANQSALWFFASSRPATKAHKSSLPSNPQLHSPPQINLREMLPFCWCDRARRRDGQIQVDDMSPACLPIGFEEGLSRAQCLVGLWNKSSIESTFYTWRTGWSISLEKNIRK